MTLPGVLRSARPLTATIVVVAMVGAGAMLGTTPAPRSDPTAPGQAVPEPIVWEPCQPQGFECALVPVPLDPSDPDGPRIGLAAARAPATGTSEERIGSLFVNPGGPGGSANQFVRRIVPSFAQEVRDAFDIVAFNPRGVMPSEPTITCPAGGDLDDPRWADELPSSEADWTEFFTESTPRLAESSSACQLALARTGSFYGTNVVVEDLDWLRRAVGDDGLNYWGVSYGTRIGEVYAQRHPDSIRAMVLDGNVDPASTFVGFSAERAGSYDGAFAFFAGQFPGADEHFDTVAQALAAGPIEVIEAQSGDPFPLTYAAFIGRSLMATLPSEANWPVIAGELEALAAQVEGGPTATVVLIAPEENQNTVNTQVNCTDLPGRPDVGTMITTATSMSLEGPIFGPAMAQGLVACFGFPLPVDAVPHTPPASVPPVLLIGTEHDPATPYVWSERMRDFLPGSMLVTYEGAQHGVWNGPSPCVNDAANAYVLELTPPAPGLTCPFVMPEPPEAGALVEPLVVPLG